MRTTCVLYLWKFSLVNRFYSETFWNHLQCACAKDFIFKAVKNLLNKNYREKQGPCHILEFSGGSNLKLSPVNLLDKRSRLRRCFSIFSEITKWFLVCTINMGHVTKAMRSSINIFCQGATQMKFEIHTMCAISRFTLHHPICFRYNGNQATWRVDNLQVGPPHAAFILQPVLFFSVTFKIF